MVEAVIEHHFGKRPRSLKKLGSAFTNFVYDVETDEGNFVVRVSGHPAKMQYFIKEQWAVARARERGVPAPEILEVGNEVIPTPYMIVRKVEGGSALTHPERLKIINEMGRYSSVINTVPTSGFGHVFDWSNNTLSKKETWKDFLEKDLEIDKRLGIFEKNEIFPKKDFERLCRRVDDMRAWDMSPTLNHSDMRLKNVLVNEEGKITGILDWENCVSAIAPHWEISIAIHDLTIDEKHAFLDGYGIREKDFAKIADGVKTINIMNYAGVIEFFVEQKNQKGIEQMKLRLNGHLDLYSL